MTESLLSIRDLCVRFPSRRGDVTAVDGVSLDVRSGECLGVVGESGSGKSVTFASVMGLVRKPGYVAGGTIAFEGRELTTLSEPARRKLRGGEIALTMQDALTALNPALTVGEQITEMIFAHEPARSHRVAKDRAVEMLRLVGIPSAEERLNDYPHQFSGGMRQRIMLATALVCGPKLLIADEPTTALDVTIQAQVLELLGKLRRELGMTLVLITHDLGVVAEHTDRVAVMYAGEVVELGPTRAVLDAPRHPYTKGLLGSIVRLSHPDAPVRPIEGQVPELLGLAPGCRFRARCPMAIPACATPVAMTPVGDDREARCIRAQEVSP